MVNAVIFDMDGLMFDTEALWAEQWPGALAAFGLEEKPGLADAARGTTGEAALAVIRSFYGDAVDAAALFDEFRRRAALRFERGVPAKPGLGELLDYLRNQGIPCAVASSSPEAMIHSNLRHAGLEGYFAAVVPGAWVARSKPEPDIFLEAARRLGSAPQSTLVLEDSFPGVRAGAAGGFVTAMVPDLLQPTPEIRSLCTAVCGSLFEVRDGLVAGTLG